jgi:hypothetical protein
LKDKLIVALINSAARFSFVRFESSVLAITNSAARPYSQIQVRI